MNTCATPPEGGLLFHDATATTWHTKIDRVEVKKKCCFVEFCGPLCCPTNRSPSTQFHALFRSHRGRLRFHTHREGSCCLLFRWKTATVQHPVECFGLDMFTRLFFYFKKKQTICGLDDAGLCDSSTPSIALPRSKDIDLAVFGNSENRLPVSSRAWTCLAVQRPQHQRILSHCHPDWRSHRDTFAYTEDLVARTFVSVLSCRARRSTLHFHTHMRVAQDDSCCQECCVLSRCASRITASHSMFHRTLLGVPDTFSSFCSSPPQTTPTSRPLTGIRSTPCATSLEGMQSGHLAGPLVHTGYEPKSLIDASSEHRPIN